MSHSETKKKLSIIEAIQGILFIALFFYSILEGSILAYILLILPITVIIVILLHETGHLISGKLFHYKLIAFKASFLTWEKVNHGFRFSLKQGFIDGFCSMVPTKKSLKSRNVIIFTLGGVIMNLITGDQGDRFTGPQLPTHGFCPYNFFYGQLSDFDIKILVII